MVNPNGTHTVIHKAGKNVSVLVNPDGTHTVQYRNDNNTITQVNPNGTHSIIYKKKKRKGFFSWITGSK